VLFRHHIIPGTERIKKQMFKAEDGRLVIPSVGPVLMRGYMTRLMMKPIKPRRRQTGLAGTGLFAQS